MTVINYNNLKDYEIKRLIDLAGFKIITETRGFTLVDKNSNNADSYAELRFLSLIEAIKTVQPYLKQFRLVA